MRKMVHQLIDGLNDDYQKAEAIYNYVNNEFTIDSSGYELRPIQKHMKNLYKKRYGAPFELNILLVELLKMAKIKAYPVLINTCNRVSFLKSARFNHMIASAEINGKQVLMDASGKNCPLGYFPSVCCAKKGLLVDYNLSRIVSMETKVCKL